MTDGYLRIGEFSERVGITPDLLRAWERRYEVLRPDRSEGGFRLYTDEDIARIERMTGLMDEGLSAAEAARLARTGTEPGPTEETAGEDPSLESRRQRLARALDDFEWGAAQQTLDELFAAFNLETVLRDALMPYLAEVGERWASGELTVGQEHFASNFLRGRLLAIGRGWGLGVGPTALLAAPPGEAHDLPLIVFGLTLWRRGWRIVFVGADTPVDSLADTVAAVRPDLVVLAAVDPAVYEAAADELATIAAEVRTAIGGRGASDDLAAAIGAERLAGDPVTAAERIASD